MLLLSVGAAAADFDDGWIGAAVEAAEMLPCRVGLPMRLAEAVGNMTRVPGWSGPRKSGQD
jgi:hypothetical protein